MNEDTHLFLEVAAPASGGPGGPGGPYQPRVAQPREALSPLGEGLFVSGGTRYRFAIGGQEATLTVTGADGSSSTFARTSRAVAPRKG